MKNLPKARAIFVQFQHFLGSLWANTCLLRALEIQLQESSFDSFHQWSLPATASSHHLSCGINPAIQHLALLYLHRGLLLLSPSPSANQSLWFYLHFYLLQTPGSLLYFPRQQCCYQCQIFQAVRTLLNQNSLKPLTGSLKVKHLTTLHWG